MNIQKPLGQTLLKAPDFPSGAEWINTERPLSMSELRGRVVLLDFWTYCCINCMHILPDLVNLERKYGDRLIVIGVHSAKFEGEKDTQNIRDAVRRYSIHHPVLNDKNFVLWKKLGVQSWPTLVLINSEGYIVGQVSGEGNFDRLDRAIGHELSARGVNAPALQPLPISDENEAKDGSLLLYPGKVLADRKGGRLFIADSGHNRIVVADIDTGDIIDFIGSGKAELRDGGFGEAGFSNPHGMALRGNMLSVADTDNHALRVIDSVARTVRTLAGNGKQAPWGSLGGKGTEARLNSPWDIVFLNDKLYIAMAGPHQIWEYDPATGQIGIYAGSGSENILDGNRREAALAQPSGITTDGQDIFFADSETSSIRKISMRNGVVSTLVGTGLFDFGFRDGDLGRALLQHPLGVVRDSVGLWIADTYNNRIRWINLIENTITTRAGGNDDGLVDGPGDIARFDEPGGVSVDGGRLFVADTNNHVVRVLDTVHFDVTTFPLAEVLGISEGKSRFEITILPPEGHYVNEEAPSMVEMSYGEGASMKQQPTITLSRDSLKAVFDVPGGYHGLKAVFSGNLYICTKGGNGICSIRPFSFVRKLRTTKEPGSKHAGVYMVSPPGKATLPDLKE
ncbi:redoxin domain-containing protein [bacterium]|nr:redoxin domain-containing protein [bacterium]